MSSLAFCGRGFTPPSCRPHAPPTPHLLEVLNTRLSILFLDPLPCLQGPLSLVPLVERGGFSQSLASHVVVQT